MAGMICPRCHNPHDDPHRKQCAYCQVANSQYRWHIADCPSGVEDQATDAVRESLQEGVDMSAGGWIE